MDEAQKDELLNGLFQRLDRIQEIESSVKQMREYLKLKEYLADIWTDGYKAGLKVGKKDWVKEIPSN